MLVEAQSWDSVIKHCEDCYKTNKGFKPIVTLVKQLAKSSYAKDLYPITSMNTIIISQTPKFDMHREVMTIDFNIEKEYFTLEFRQQQFHQPYDSKKKNWTRYCPPEKVYSVIVKFFRLQKWFAEFPD